MKWVTISEASKLLGVGRSILYRAIEAGEIPYLDVGRGRYKRRLLDLDEVRPILERDRRQKEATLSVSELAAATGLSESKIRRWTAIGVLKPACGGGRGKIRRYSLNEVLEVVKRAQK